MFTAKGNNLNVWNFGFWNVCQNSLKLLLVLCISISYRFSEILRHMNVMIIDYDMCKKVPKKMISEKPIKRYEGSNRVMLWSGGPLNGTPVQPAPLCSTPLYRKA